MFAASSLGLGGLAAGHRNPGSMALSATRISAGIKVPQRPASIMKTSSSSTSTKSGLHPRGRPSSRVIARASDSEEPDWEQEMSIFKQRTMRPNQLATLRELESKVSVGKVRARARYDAHATMCILLHLAASLFLALSRTPFSTTPHHHN